MWSPSAIVLVQALLALSALSAYAQTLVKWDDGTGLHVYYRTGWSAPNIHYTTGGSTWTATPGVKMTVSTDAVQFAKADGWFRFDLPAPAAFLEFAFNDNNGAWDSNGGANYNVQSAGTYAITSSVSTPPAAACTNFDGPDYCTAATQTTYAAADDARIWQTPPRNTTGWTAAAQDYRSLTGYANVVYASSRTSATVDVRTTLRGDKASTSCSYSFNNAWTSSSTFKADSALKTDLNIKVACTYTPTGESWTLELDPVNFVWQANAVSQPAGMAGGQKGAIVDLFGWPYADIEAECKDFLGKAGYMGVKISPPQEAVLSDRWPAYGERNPWYFVYQPVSYRLHSRMGTRAQLRSMIQTCRANNVRVYADAVVNHMSATGNDVSEHHRTVDGSTCKKWGALSSAKGSPYFTHKSQYEANKYTGARPTLEFPAVPFAPTDFHCERSIDSYTDAFQLQNGWLVGLSDLNTAKPYVRQRIAQYFVDLLGIGFSGFRIDAFKHIGPTDAAAILGELNTAMGGSLPADFLMWGEVLVGPADADLIACNENSGYNFYKGLDAKYAAAGISATDIAKLKIWSADYPKSHPICGSWILPASRFVIQNDDHDQQSPDSVSRDMGDKGSVLIKDKNVAKHRGFETQLFSRTDADWKVKVVLSSYTYFANGAAGFPDGLSDCTNGFDTSAGQTCSKNMAYEKAFRAGSCGYTVESFVGGKYTRVHRDLAIVNAMRKWVGLSTVTLAQVGITGTC